jgi:hypothetical protein
MVEGKMSSKKVVAPWARVTIILASLAAILIISRVVAGSFLPTEGKDILIFQNALLLIVLGSALSEHKYTAPPHSMYNGLIGAVTLVPIYENAPKVAWWAVFAYCVAVFVIAGIHTTVGSREILSPAKERVARLTYKPSIFFGKARVLYSVVFLFGVLSFYAIQSVEMLVLVIFWGIFLALWPLGLPELLSGFRRKAASIIPSGRIIRTEAPNMIWARIEADAHWNPKSVKLYQQSNKMQFYVIPLFAQEHGEDIIGVGLCAGKIPEPIPNLMSGFLYEDSESNKDEEEIARLLGADKGTKLAGFIAENSSIEAVRFQTITPTCCEEGMTVWCKIGENRVYYQVTEGATKEEPLESNKHGFQVATASQLGLLDSKRGFTKYGWLPAMNTPVFIVSESFGSECAIIKEGDFTYGNIPGTALEIGGAFSDMTEYHTAILGITGSGKTELAFDLIRYAVGAETKVICVDLTRRYEGRLSDLEPNNLSLSEPLSKALGEKLFDVETGKYGAGDEKKALREFAEQIRTEIEQKVKEFIESKEDKDRVGIITLEEISNTKATIYVTELFLTRILHYARDNADTCPRILIVLEEAHTIVPETSTMGLGDFESKGLVAKIAQIALQGRKYGVGLLVIALTQCNTIVTFTCFDNTSLDFLKNVLDEHHTALVPNLPFLQAVVFGKGVKSERPIVVQIPFDEDKQKAPRA